MSFREQLERLRAAIASGPTGLTVAEWVYAAGVSRDMVEPRYRASVSEDNRVALARAAAKVLGWDQGQMEAWLLFGQEEPTLEAFLAELPNLARCAGPDCKGRWHKRSEIVKGLSRCKACCRIQKRNPQADAIFVVVKQKLPEIRAVHPALASALETCLQDTSHALTVARVQRIMNISRVKTEMLMKAHGLDKATVAEAAKSRSTFR